MNFKNNTAAKVSYTAIMYKRIIKIMTHEKKKKMKLFLKARLMILTKNIIPKVILELEPGAAEQPDSRGKNYLHTAIIKVEDKFQRPALVLLLLQSDLESLLFLISINVNVHSKTTDSNKLAPILLAVQVTDSFAFPIMIKINQVGNEMMVRNLLLAGASTQERTLTGQTGAVSQHISESLEHTTIKV